MDTMRKIKLILSFLTLLSLSLSAQDFKVVRDNCMPAPEGVDDVVETRLTGMRKMLPQINRDWNPEKTYHQLVILMSFSDTDFNIDNPVAEYDKILNQSGYNKRQGPGCMADYFRDQSGGMLNLEFDVYGPYKVSGKAQPYSSPSSDTRNYGRTDMIEATNLFLADHQEIDFSQYDWNGDGSVEQVIYVYAGLSGNISSTDCYGHIWPNTSTFTTITTHDGKKISNYTCSGEHWPMTNKASCGFGTISHEFTHSLGLPDIYPTAGEGFSVVDEWDLMDGGNFTNYGWCPPEYTALEKWLMGWISFKELDEPTTVVGLKPVSEGGDVYRIKHSDSEWLLLENRQQRGWDAGAPGSGLVIYHVFYDGSVWQGNRVNTDKNKRRFHLFNADNRDYDAWDDYLDEKGLGTYANAGRMNSRYLSTSPYPWTNETTMDVNDELTDSSVPAAKMNYPNAKEELMLSKPITNISVDDDGLVSFDFMGGGTPTAIRGIARQSGRESAVAYDLNGRRLSQPSRKGIYILRQSDGTIVKKVFK